VEVIMESPEEVNKPLAADIAKSASISNINYNEFKEFLKTVKKGVRGIFELNTTFTIDLGKNEMYIRGYELQSFGGGRTFICSSNSPTVFTIGFASNNKNIIEALEYLYHVCTCV
jgi:hypothetical protein